MNADIKTFIGEATAYDKKQQLEVKRPKSWLKKVFLPLPMARAEHWCLALVTMTMW